MKMFAACAAAAALATLSAGSASAQDVDVAFNLAVTSDYVYRGASQTDENPAISGGVDLTSGSFYAGAWASNVDFGDGTDTEIDVYGGYRTEAAGFGLDFGVIGYLYVGEPSGADYEFIELKAAASRAVGPVSVGAAVYYSPDFYGAADEEAVYTEVNAAFSPMDKVTISGAIGNQYMDVSSDYVTWNLGLGYALSDVVGFDIRYHDTDVSGSPLYEDRFVATLKAAF